MTEESDNQKILLHVLTGAGLTLLLYLFFKDQFKNQQPLLQAPQQLQSLSQPINIDYQKINELERHIYELERQSQQLKEELSFHRNKLTNQEQLQKETYNLKQQLEITQKQLQDLSQFQHYQMNQNTKTYLATQQIPIKKMDNKDEQKRRQAFFNMA